MKRIIILALCIALAMTATACSITAIRATSDSAADKATVTEQTSNAAEATKAEVEEFWRRAQLLQERTEAVWDYYFPSDDGVDYLPLAFLGELQEAWDEYVYLFSMAVDLIDRGCDDKGSIMDALMSGDIREPIIVATRGSDRFGGEYVVGNDKLWLREYVDVLFVDNFESTDSSYDQYKAFDVIETSKDAYLVFNGQHGRTLVHFQPGVCEPCAFLRGAYFVSA